MSAPADAAAAGREDDGDDDSSVGFLSSHLQELDILPTSGLTEGGKWLLLAWLRKQQGVARHLYLPGWVKGRAGEDIERNRREALLKNVLGEREREKEDRKNVMKRGSKRVGQKKE